MSEYNIPEAMSKLESEIKHAKHWKMSDHDAGYLSGLQYAEALFKAAIKEFSLSGVWVKASDRLPEFEHKEKKYVVKLSPDYREIWIWDWINEREAVERGQSTIEWLDESGLSESSSSVSIDEQKAVEIVKMLAEWSRKYPRGVIYPMSQKKMDDELIAIENMAKELIKSTTIQDITKDKI